MRVLTLTLQPAIDRVLQIEKLARGATFDARPLLVVPAGKGVNTARALAMCGTGSPAHPRWRVPGCPCRGLPRTSRAANSRAARATLQAAVWIGAEDAEWYSRRLRAISGIEALCCTRNCATRHAITLLDSRGAETHVKELMPAPSAAEQRELLRFWAKTVRRGSIVAVCGSAPGGTARATLRKIFEIARARGAAQIIADTNGALLEVAGAAGLDGIKGNGAEIGAWLGLPKAFDPWLRKHRAALAGAFKRRGAPKTIIITRGKHGAVAARAGELVVAQVVRLHGQPTAGLPVPHKSGAATGCGDAATAGWLWALQDACALDETLRRVVACGSAKLASVDPGGIDVSRVKKLLKAVEIQAVKWDVWDEWDV